MSELRQSRQAGPPRSRAQASVIWLMALLVLFAAMAPTVSRALASSGAGEGQWIEVCSSNGIKRVLVDAETGDAEERDLHLDHCHFCLSQYQFRDTLPTAVTKQECLR